MINQTLDKLPGLQTPVYPPLLFMTLVPKGHPLPIVTRNLMLRQCRSGNIPSNVPRRIPGRGHLTLPIDVKPLHILLKEPINQPAILPALRPAPLHLRQKMILPLLAQQRIRQEWNGLPLTPSQPPFRYQKMHMGVELQVPSKRVHDGQNPRNRFRLLALNHFQGRLSGAIHHHLEQKAMPKDDLPKFLRKGQHQMTMGHIDELIHRPLNPFIRVFFATGRAETSLTGKRTLFLGSTMRANIFGITIRRIPAGEHLLHRLHDGLPMRRLVSPG